ncbi:peroxiredoxin [Marimonas arenosa]|uniref:thioredoxin-dependent peroxiredoxin n=1 Tax=Marimonas arenosa TaxID=1795305 RepID=A0AAE3WC30_9RHOB|nr:peroxiredoxin [Marimonas arenosa]MDQ2089042.1 peroxiredoxin [Marimonas arenosa]
MTDLPRPAPEFSLPGDDGTTYSLAGLKGTPFVLFFYPRDNTSGCTKEAIGFSTLKSEFDALGVKLFGVSKDSLASHEKFRAKQGLTTGLLSDEDSDACEAFGVWQEKKMYGKTFFGIVRSTFLIDAAGQIVREWRKVKVDGHAEDVLAAARDL